MKIDRPLRLIENRVSRIYRGGALLDRFHGRAEESDGLFPENWVGSDTVALGGLHPEEGLSRVQTGSRTESLASLLAQDPDALLGPGHRRRIGDRIGILVKELDSLVRLPIQAHPDRAFSRQHLGSPYGKTETWYILGGREINGQAPHVYLGFTEAAGPEAFWAAYRDQRVDDMLSMLHRVEVRPHDFLVIPGRVPHAIGPGVCCIEVQEPTDFVFQLDRKGPCWDLTPEQMHMGLGEDRMMDCFDFSGLRGNALLGTLRSRVRPREGVVDLLGGGLREFFGVSLATVTRSLRFVPKAFTIVLALSGEGWLDAKRQIRIRKGDAFVLPIATGALEIVNEGSEPLTLFMATPPLEET